MNKIPLDISNGLTDHEIGAGEYIILTKGPTGANVTVKANDSFKAGWPLKVGHSLRGKKEIRKIFVSCDAVAGESITLHQADSNDDFELTTPPSTVDVDTITKIDDRFRPNGTAWQETIAAAGSFLFTKTTQTILRFHSSNEVGVELDGNTIKYPMFEEELRIDNITTVRFYNDTAAAIVVTALEM